MDKQQTLPEGTVQPGARGAAGGMSPSVYHLVKAMAAEPLEKIVDELLRHRDEGLPIHGRNAKGMGGLQAALAAKRWDLAQKLIELGCDPLAKDKFGHCFFIDLVKTDDAPWETVLSGRPDLVDRHQRHLAEKRDAGHVKAHDNAGGGKKRGGKHKAKEPRRKESERMSGEQLAIQETLSVTDPCDGKEKTIGSLFDEISSVLAETPKRVADFIKAGGHPGFERDGVTLGIGLALAGRAAIVSAEEAGWSWDTPNLRGETPLLRCAAEGLMDEAKALCQMGVKMDSQDDDGRTALLLAIDRGDIDMAELLLSYGATPSVHDSKGRTAETEAKSMGGDFGLLFSDSDKIPPQSQNHQSQNHAPRQEKQGRGGRGKSGRQGGRRPQGGGRVTSLDKPLRDVDDTSKWASAASLSEQPGKKAPVIVIKRSRLGLGGSGTKAA